MGDFKLITFIQYLDSVSGILTRAITGKHVNVVMNQN